MSRPSRRAGLSRRLRPGPWGLVLGALLATGCATATTDSRPVSPPDPLGQPGGPPAMPVPIPPAVATPEETADRLLAAEVARTLAADPALRDAVIEAEVHRGQVTLMGTVPTFRERALAIDAALRVPGVRSVRPQLLLQNP